MKAIDAPLEIVMYLDGDLNSGFFRLKRSTTDLLDELSVYAGDAVRVRYVNPSLAENANEREQKYAELSARGLTPTAVYERDKEGKAIQKVIFPWAEISYKGRTLPVSLLKNIGGNSGEQNLNISIENLEFELTDVIRQLTTRTITKIAFIEGHGELTEAETYDISKTLSRYFQIDRGILESNAAVLDDYRAVIIAGPTERFSESDKYIIDQYIMNGGRVLWLMDGVRIAHDQLSATGKSPAIELDLNLSDLLFRYGVRVNPVILQDMQSVNIPVNIAPAGANPQFEPIPWLYAPLLLTSGGHPVSQNVPEVRAEFASAISLVGESKRLTPYFLLASSDNSHVITTPATIDLAAMPNIDDKAYFNASYIPVAVSLEGIFDSNFANRMTPKELVNTRPILKESVPTRQIVIANRDIIRNETNGIASDTTTLELGLDRYTGQVYGNKEFIRNAVLFLTDNDGWMELRSQTFKLRLLNKNIINNDSLRWQIINVVLPILLLAVFGGVFLFLKRRRYTR